MEYSIQKLCQISGITPRTLRHYDAIGLLKPLRVSASGYRIYGPEEVDLLQLILFYRALEMELSTIKSMIQAEGFDVVEALKAHRQRLFLKQQELMRLIGSIDETIAAKEGSLEMKDQDKFKAFKEKLVSDNETTHGAEIRERYGKETVEASNRKMLDLSEAEYVALEKEQQLFFETILEAFHQGDPKGAAAMRAAGHHKNWLMGMWPSYSKEAHLGLAEMYVADERFTAYYDKHQEGLTAFLLEVIKEYTSH